MSYKTLLRNGAMLIVVSMLTLTACKRNKDTTPALSGTDDNGGYASDAAKLDQNSNDIISLTDAAVATGSANLRTTSTCATVTNDTIGHLLTIDFGTTACMCADGKTRSGKILVNYTGHYKDSAGMHSITTNNYFVNGYQVKVHKTVTNMGMNTSGQYWYNVTVNDSIILGTDSVISWVGNRTRTWDAGYATPMRSDDVYLIGGTTTLTRANGHVFVHAISPTDPLKIALACNWIESGTVTISSSSFTVLGSRTLNYGYGGGGCDNQAQLTLGSHSYVITMH